MTEGTTGAPGWAARAAAGARDWLTAGPAHVGYAVVGLVLLLSWPFGGWEPAEEERPGATSPGTPVTAAPFTVTVDRVVAGPDLGAPFPALDTGAPGQADDQHVLLFLTVRNDSDATLPVSDVYRELVTVHGLGEPVTSTGTPQDPLSAWGTVYQDHAAPQLVSGLGPGLDYRLVLHQPVSGEVPTELVVDLHGRTLRESTLEDEMRWADPVLVTSVTVPVEQAPGPVFAAAEGLG